MLKVVLSARVSPALVARSTYPVPVLLIDRFENVATPFTAFTGVVPDRVPPPGLVWIAIPTDAALVVTRLLYWSSTRTVTARVSVALVARTTYPVPVLLIDRFEIVATPFTAFTGVVPDRVPPPGLVWIA